MLVMQRQALELRRRLMNPPNAVPDKPINLRLRRRSGVKGVTGPEFERLREEAREKKRQAAKTAREAAIRREVMAEMSREVVVESVSITDAQPVKLGELPTFDRHGPLTIRRIQDVICAQYHLRRSELMSMQRTQNFVRPRQIGFYLSKKLTRKSLPEIGRQWGGKDHTTVLHAVRKIEARMAADANMAAEVTALMRVLEVEAQD